jgi:hypothetical protein
VGITMGTNMPMRLAKAVSALLLAACAAFGLYVLVHDDLGIPDHSIILDSFGSAAALAAMCIVADLKNRRVK